MLPPVENYHGREQSFIKHLFLNRYLESAAYKLLQGRSPVFNFVDAFAGPWRASDSNEYSDASFSQAIQTLEKVRQALIKTGRSGLQIRFSFCERNPAAVAKLRQFAKQKSEFDIYVFEGPFEENLRQIQEKCSDGFTFTFIDPTGWNVDTSKIFKFLKEIKGEFLFNYMTEEVNRHAGWDGVEASFGRFIANPDWREEFEALPSGSNETRVLTLLKRKMKEAGVATYLPDMAIQKPREKRIKMRLILGTHNPTGLDVFRKIQEDVEKVAIQARHAIKTKESGQLQLFPNEKIIEFERDRDGVGCSTHLQLAEEELLRLISNQPGISFKLAAGAVMEKIPVRTTHMNKIAVRNLKSNNLHFKLPKGKRTPIPETRLWPDESKQS